MAGESAAQRAASSDEGGDEAVSNTATASDGSISSSDTTPETEAILESPSDETGLDRTGIFEVLSNERRRLVLRYLQQREVEEGVDFRDLVDQVAAWENGTTIDRLDSSDRKCVYTALRQTHLPKLDEFGVVEYDNRRGTVTPTAATEAVTVYMEYAPEDDVVWSRFYLLLAAVSGVFTAFVWIGTPPFDGVSGFAIAGVTVVLFGAAAVAQAYQSRTGPSGIQ